MKGKLAIPVIASILIIGIIAIIPALAAQGTITDVNPPGNHGKITEDGTGDVFNFGVPRDLVDKDYVPEFGDRVTFSPGNGKKATDVSLVPIPSCEEICVDILLECIDDVGPICLGEIEACVISCAGSP